MVLHSTYKTTKTNKIYIYVYSCVIGFLRSPKFQQMFSRKNATSVVLCKSIVGTKQQKMKKK